ncbi:hypothetical protein VTN77DRAFT_6331 [Rasamsonia byssochlamydoides]|uniref:uncharacterized protein n=1 Tax=Rasamsonia byssochlamydoides TaxID=89139 RepID=UPI0037421EDC
MSHEHGRNPEFGFADIRVLLLEASVDAIAHLPSQRSRGRYPPRPQKTLTGSGRIAQTDRPSTVQSDHLDDWLSHHQPEGRTTAFPEDVARGLVRGVEFCVECFISAFLAQSCCSPLQNDGTSQKRSVTKSNRIASLIRIPAVTVVPSEYIIRINIKVTGISSQHFTPHP